MRTAHRRASTPKRTDAGPLAVAREFLSATIQQTYSTDAAAILNDQSYRDQKQLVPTHFSPVRIDVRASPKQEFNVSFRTQFDGRWHKFQTYAPTRRGRATACRSSWAGTRCISSRTPRARTSSAPSATT